MLNLSNQIEEDLEQSQKELINLKEKIFFLKKDKKEKDRIVKKILKTEIHDFLEKENFLITYYGGYLQSSISLYSLQYEELKERLLKNGFEYKELRPINSERRFKFIFSGFEEFKLYINVLS